MDHIDNLRYPVGPLQRIREPLDRATFEEHVAIIADMPARLRSLLEGVTDAQLDTAYRPDGWTVRQVVHHVADSHMNAYVRLKLAATEESPIVKTYDEARWAELPEAKAGPVDVSLALIAALHTRMVAFLRGLSDADLRRAFKHSEWGDVRIDECITMYSWHCRHHLAHVALGLATSRYSPV